MRVAIGILLGVTPGPLLAQQFACSDDRISPYPTFVDVGLDHQRYAPAAQGIKKEFTAFFAAFDDNDDDSGDGQPDLRFNPEYVSYELRGVRANENGDYEEPDVSIDRPNKWYESAEFAPFIATVTTPTRRLDDSYSGVGTIWNRGHLAMSDHAQRVGAEAACNTHHFWNASPEAADLNQGPWLHLENYSGAAANKFRSVWVVAGPIFDRSTPRLVIGDAGEVPVEVPDAFFKVIIHESPSKIDTLAFVFEQPNVRDAQGRVLPTGTWVRCDRAQSLNHMYDHRRNLVAIRDIERRTGLRFFPAHPRRQALVAARATQLWPVETRYWDPGRSTCAGQRSHP
jgi:DNA/RNA endonuclease G (NUC1)